MSADEDLKDASRAVFDPLAQVQAESDWLTPLPFPRTRTYSYCASFYANVGIFTRSCVLIIAVTVVQEIRITIVEPLGK